jgi:hypothetical protein
LRVKTVWFRKQDARAPEEAASVLAATLWRLADQLVENLSRAGYDIVTPARGLRILAEVLAFGLHLCDRRAHARCWPERERAALVQATGARLADIMEQNVSALGAPGQPAIRAEFVALLNRRGDDYATFEMPESGASFPALRCLGAQIREIMEWDDQHWIMDQVMDVEMPELLGTLNKALDGLVSPRPAAG